MEEQKEPIIPREEQYEPRPVWQVWVARAGLVIAIGFVILQILQIATGGL